MSGDWRQRRRTRARGERVALVLELETLRAELTTPGPLPGALGDFRLREQQLLYLIEQLDHQIAQAQWSDEAEDRRITDRRAERAAGRLTPQLALRALERKYL